MQFKVDNVRFLADDSRLLGMYCFFASDVGQLQRAVVGDIHGTVGKLKFTGDTNLPFLLTGTVMTYKFCYPLWCSSFFQLYSQGKTIYYNTGLDNGWRVVPPSTDISDQKYWSNDFIYTDVRPHCLSTGSSDVAVNCTWEQLAQWLALGYGFLLRPDGVVVTSVSVGVDKLGSPVEAGFLVRVFESDKWVSPTLDYIADPS